MSNVTKWLVAIAGVLICAEIAGPTIHDTFFHQLASQQQTLAKVTRQLHTKERALHLAQATTRKFERRARLNFESDVAKARLTYQEFLLRLTDACTLSSVMISSSQPERLEELGHVLNFSVQATGTTEQFGKLIDGFYRTEALHRISHLNIFQSLGPDSPTHSLTMDVALLVLGSSSRSSGELPSPPPEQLKDLFAAQDIFRKRTTDFGSQSGAGLASGMNMFSNLFSSLPAPPPEPPVADPSSRHQVPPPASTTEPIAATDPKANLRLVGIIAKGSKKYALFFDVTRDMQYCLIEKSELREIGINARISRIDVSDISLEEEDQQLELSLGKLYSEAVQQ